MKYFRMSYEEVVYNRSYINIMLLNRSIPSSGLEENEKDEEILTEDDSIGKRRRKDRKKGKMHSSEYFMQFM